MHKLKFFSAIILVVLKFIIFTPLDLITHCCHQMKLTVGVNNKMIKMYFPNIKFNIKIKIMYLYLFYYNKILSHF